MLHRDRASDLSTWIANRDHAALADEVRALAESGSLRDAHVHPLGFVHVPLYRSRSFGIALHVWEPDRIDPPESLTIHTHAWPLASVVLAGSVRNLTYSADWVAARPTDPTVLAGYQATSAGMISTLARTGVGAVPLLTGQRVYERGSGYLVPTGVLHASIAARDRVTVTVMWRGERVDTPTVLGDSGLPPTIITNRVLVEGDSERLLNETVASALLGAT